jgi:hypothetical protein
MKLKCIGCDSEIPWDGKGLFAYTCPCGATVLYDADTMTVTALPASLIMAIHEKRSVPHIDYYVGSSNHTSDIKEKFIKELLDHGFIWMKDCRQCQEDGTYRRHLEREKYLALEEAERIIKQ